MESSQCLVISPEKLLVVDISDIILCIVFCKDYVFNKIMIRAVEKWTIKVWQSATGLTPLILATQEVDS
jgi:hypothetical protein